MDHYKTLGVDRSASAEEIKRAFRRLASQHHPDKGGDKAQFQNIQQAYAVLGDDEKRAQYDHAMSRPQQIPINGMPGFDFDAIFQMFGTRFGRDQEHMRPNIRIELWIELEDLARGTKKTLTLNTPQGPHVIELDVPLGIDEGEAAVYPKLAPGGHDLQVMFRVRPHARFSRKGFNIYTDVPIPIWLLVAGGDINIQDLSGHPLRVTVPPRTNPGSQLRLRGKGLTNRRGEPGDLLVRLQGTIPANISERLLDAINQELR